MMVLSSLPPWAINLTICTLTAVLTQVASNTATANVLLPILADMALTICVNPIYLIMSAALTSSYAFMLPVSMATKFGILENQLLLFDIVAIHYGMELCQNVYSKLGSHSSKCHRLWGVYHDRRRYDERRHWTEYNNIDHNCHCDQYLCSTDFWIRQFSRLGYSTTSSKHNMSRWCYAKCIYGCILDMVFLPIYLLNLA